MVGSRGGWKEWQTGSGAEQLSSKLLINPMMIRHDDTGVFLSGIFGDLQTGRLIFGFL